VERHKPKALEGTSLQEPEVELKVDLTAPRLVSPESSEVASSELSSHAIPNHATTAIELVERSDVSASNDTSGSIEGVSSGSSLGLPQCFKVVSTLGEGGMATVFKAYDSTRDEMVAIKILKQELARDPVVVERFEREARASQRITHANIVRVFDCGMTSMNTPYLVMEYVEGSDLSQIISEEGHLCVDRGVNIFVQLCSVLKKAHDIGLVHRDIKPSNILISKDENGDDVVKLADFGIAKPPNSERAINPSLTHTGSILGSPAYMSPEQAMGEIVDERSDIYSLGCVMYETLTGRSPFAADTPVKSIVKHIEQSAEPFEIEFAHLNIPKGLEDTILKCLYKKPVRRFQRVYQLEHALTNVPAPGIYKRLLSHFIDAFIIMFGGFLLQGAISSLVPAAGTWVAIILISLYYALFESSKLQATPGKLIMGLKACDSKGGRLSFLSVMACLSAIWFCVAMLVMSVGAFFVTTVFFAHPTTSAVSWSTFICIWFMIINGMPSAYNHGRQDLFDMMFSRVVTKPYYSKEGLSNCKPKFEWRYVMLTCLFLILPCIASEIVGALARTVNAVGTRSVVVAKHKIPAGTTITPDMLIVRHSFPSLVAPAFYADSKDVVGREAALDIGISDAFSSKTLADQSPDKK